jgi:hypothetical protein
VILSEVEITGEGSSRKFLNPLPSRSISPLVAKVELAQPIACHHFDAAVVMLAMTLYFQGGFRFRVVDRTLSILGQVFPGLPSFPGYSTVRSWAHRIGLYRLTSARPGPRWAMICDHTASFGGQKMFVICCVDLDMLERRVETKEGNYSLSHEDVQPLAIVPMKSSNGESLFQLYLESIAIHGNPEQMVIDGGSDLQKSGRLLVEHQKNQGVAITRCTYDISHRIARIIQAELESTEQWQGLETMVKDARQYTKYRARHLSPPNLSHGPDRWMNLGGILKWYSDMMDRIKLGDNGTALPRFGITERVIETGRATYRKCGKLFRALVSMCGKEHPSEDVYKKALKEKCPNMPTGMEGYLDEKKDLNETYLEEIMPEWQKHQGIHEEVTGMLRFTNAIQKHIKLEGLSKESMKDCQEIYEEAALKGVGRIAGGKVMEMLEEMAKDLKWNQRIIATSDVLESLNGKWKMLIEGSPTPALGCNALLMPALMGKLNTNEVKEALETITVEDVKEWRNGTFGVTYHQEKRVNSTNITS